MKLLLKIVGVIAIFSLITLSCIAATWEAAKQAAVRTAECAVGTLLAPVVMYIEGVKVTLDTVITAGGLALEAGDYLIDEAGNLVSAGGEILYDAGSFTIDGIEAGGSFAIDQAGNVIDGTGNAIGKTIDVLKQGWNIIGEESITIDGVSVTSEQENLILTVIGVAHSLGRTEREIIIMLMTGLTESRLRNLSYGDRDSVNWLQQRPSLDASDGTPYWGTVEELMQLEYSTTRFFEEMDKYPEVDSLSLNDAAQRIQRSGVPQGYATWEDKAREIYARYGQAIDGEVYVIGDSRTAAINNELRTLMSGGRFAAATIDTRQSRRIANGDDSVVSTIKKAAEEGHNLSTIIIDVGINDLQYISSLNDASLMVSDVLNNVPSSTNIAWVSVHQPDMEAAMFLNNALNDHARDNDNFAVIDWRGYVSQFPNAPYDSELSSQDSSLLQQRTSLIASVLVRPEDFGFAAKSEGINLANAFSLSSVCDLGGSVIGGAIDLISGDLGSSPERNEADPATAEYFDETFEELGSSIPENPDQPTESGRFLGSNEEIELGDIIYWMSSASEDAELQHRGIYLGSNMVVIEPEGNELVSVTSFDRSGYQEIFRLEEQLTYEEGDWRKPIASQYSVSSDYGMRLHPIDQVTRLHDGLDISAPNGTTISAVQNGEIDGIGTDAKNGRFVRINHQGGYQTRYVHLGTLASGLSVGDIVQAGEPVGKMGQCQCPNATGPHLHFSVKQNGNPINPGPFFQERGVNILSGSS